MSQESASSPADCVLDTHVALELSWFADARASALLEGLYSGRLRWQATAPMRAELESVLARLPDRSQAPPRELVMALFDRLAAVRASVPAPARLWCTDPDDQIFIDLALACGARWLFTRDRALLQLGRRAQAFGCVVAPPEHFLGAGPSGAAIAVPPPARA